MAVLAQKKLLFILRAFCADNLRAEHQKQRRFYIVLCHLLRMGIKSNALLAKRKQVAKQHCVFALLCAAGSIHHKKIFAITVAMKIAIGIIKSDSAPVIFGVFAVGLFGKCLSESCAVFQSKTAAAHKAVAFVKITFIAAACAFVSFINKNQVGAFKKIRRYGFALFLFAGFVG